MGLSRRPWFFVVAAMLVAGVLSHGRAANASPALPFVLHQVGPGIYAAIDGPDHRSGSNSGFVIGDDGVVVIDAFFNLEAAKALIGEIRRLTPKPIRYLVNTHYHLDHTGGDQAFREAGAIIIAHRNVRGWVRTANIGLIGDRMTPELRSRIETLPLPDLVTDKDLTIWLGRRKVVVRTVLGHTGGDLSVFIPDARVLFAGDLLWRRVAPNLIDGSVRQWAATDAEFAAMPDAARTTFVPGHGELADLSDVREFEAYLADLRRLTQGGRRRGLKGDALAAAVGAKLKARHPDWNISDRAANAEVRYMDEELAGTKKRLAPVPD